MKLIAHKCRWEVLKGHLPINTDTGSNHGSDRRAENAKEPVNAAAFLSRQMDLFTPPHSQIQSWDSEPKKMTRQKIELLGRKQPWRFVWFFYLEMLTFSCISHIYIVSLSCKVLSFLSLVRARRHTVDVVESCMMWSSLGCLWEGAVAQDKEISSVEVGAPELSAELSGIFSIPCVLFLFGTWIRCSVDFFTCTVPFPADFSIFAFTSAS